MSKNGRFKTRKGVQRVYNLWGVPQYDVINRLYQTIRIVADHLFWTSALKLADLLQLYC